MHLTFDPFALIRFVLAYLGNTLTMGPRKLEAVLAPLIGFIILALGALAICRLIAERRINDALLWIILFLYGPFNGLVIGAARLIHDPNSWHASRYQSVAAISLIATIALLLAALPKALRLRNFTVESLLLPRH